MAWILRLPRRTQNDNPDYARRHRKNAPRLIHSCALILLVSLIGSCKDLTSVIDSPNYTTPTILFISPVRDTIDTHSLPGGSGLPSDNVSVTITASVRAYDSVGIEGVSGSVLSPVWIETNEPSSVRANFSLTDDGQNGDVKAGDSIFTGQVTFDLLRYEIGTYYLKFQSFNTLGTSSGLISIPVYFVNSANHAPHFDTLASSPDTLVLVDTAISIGVLTAKVSDFEGARDVLKVTARATKPDGNDASTVVSLFDDGDITHADSQKGDGVYSSGIKLDPHSNPPPEKGSYVFHFTATDKSGAIAQDSLIVVVK